MYIAAVVGLQQEECAKWWIACLLLLLLQAAAWAWDSGNYPVIATETLVNVTALGLMVHFGLKTRRLFSADKNDSGPLVFKVRLNGLTDCRTAFDTEYSVYFI